MERLEKAYPESEMLARCYGEKVNLAARIEERRMGVLRVTPWNLGVAVGDRPMLPAFSATIPAALESLRIDDISDGSVKAWGAIGARFGNSRADFDAGLYG